MKLTPFEKDVLDWYRVHCEIPGLAEQLTAVVPVERNHTGVGFFLSLKLPDDFHGLKVLADMEPLTGPHVTSPRLELGAGTVLFFDDGKVDTLEVFAYGEYFPEAVDEYLLHDKG